MYLLQTLRSYQLKVEVDPEYYPKIIGPKGATIKGICSDVDVFVRFPDRSEPNLDVITITGYEKDTFKARDRILEIVKSLVSRSAHVSSSSFRCVMWIVMHCGNRENMDVLFQCTWW